MGDLSSPTRDGTHAPCIECGVLTTGLPRESLFVFFDEIARKGTQAGNSMVSFLLACFLYSFHNYLLKAEHVSGLGDGSK